MIPSNYSFDRPTGNILLAGGSITQDMIACVEFSGNRCKDLINNDLTVEIIGNTSTRAGQSYGGDLRPRGWMSASSAHTCFRFVTPTSMKINPPMTQAYWLYSFGSGTSTGQRYCGISADSALAMGIGNHNTVRIGGSSLTATNLIIPSDTKLRWSLAVITYDSAYYLKAYRDGVFISGGTTGTGLSYGTTSYYGVGCPYSVGTTLGVNWSDMWVWKRVLSYAEIISLYDSSTRWNMYQRVTKPIYFDIGQAAVSSSYLPEFLRIKKIRSTYTRL